MKRFAILLLFFFATAAPACYAQNCSPFMGVGAVQFIGNDGTPLTNGALYVFSAGTSTQAPSYSDSLCSQLNVNPVTFTTGGRVTIWIATSAFFKYVLCASSTDGPACSPANVLFSVDSVPGGATSSGGGGGAPFISNTPSPATSGVLRLSSGDSICWRNAAGSANLCIKKDANDLFSLDSGSWKLPEVGAPASVAGFDILYADNSVHRLKQCANGGSCSQVVASGNDVGLTDQVLGVHFGSSQETFGNTAPTLAQCIQFNGTTLSGVGCGEYVLGNCQPQTTVLADPASTCPYVLFVSPHTLIRLTAFATTQGSGCTTTAVIAVRDETSSTTLQSITIANGTAFTDSGAISVAMTAGHKFAEAVTTAASGCTTNPVVLVSAIYQ